MDKQETQNWLKALMQQPNGNITIVQTLRNAIMSASVLASAALVALMGVLATSGLYNIWSVAVAVLCLLASGGFSMSAIWRLSALTFKIQQAEGSAGKSAQNLVSALYALRAAAVFLFLSLCAAAVAVLWR
jgi:hypothetical protein